MPLDKLIADQQQKVSDIKAQLRALTDQVEGLNRQHSSEDGVLKGLIMARDQAVGPIKSDKKDERRMRLGAKKRVVYSLIKNGFETVGSITKALSGTDIDVRYIRDVIRKSIACKDVLGDIDDRFLLSEDGKELLQKSPLPKDWGQYEILAMKAPHPTRMNSGPEGVLAQLVKSSAAADRARREAVEMSRRNLMERANLVRLKADEERKAFIESQIREI